MPHKFALPERAALRTAPAGGARQWRGRGWMAFALLASGPVAAEIALPSGQNVTLYEVLIEEAAPQITARFRFLAPAIAREGGTVGWADAELDMAHLCANVAVPYLTEYKLEIENVVVSLSDRIVEFGASDPDATQFFDGFRLENATCIWEGF